MGAGAVPEEAWLSPCRARQVCGWRRGWSGVKRSRREPGRWAHCGAQGTLRGWRDRLQAAWLEGGVSGWFRTGGASVLYASGMEHPPPPSGTMGTLESPEPSWWLWSSGILETKGPRGAMALGIGLWPCGEAAARESRQDRTGGGACRGRSGETATAGALASGWVVERRLWGECGLGARTGAPPANVL